VARHENFQDEASAKEAAQARADLARTNELAALRDLLADQRMRDFLYRMLAKCGMFKNKFHTNAAVMGYNCGFAAMGNVIYDEIVEAFPDAWITMQVEALQRQREQVQLDQIEQQEREQQANDQE